MQCAKSEVKCGVTAKELKMKVEVYSKVDGRLVSVIENLDIETIRVLQECCVDRTFVTVE